MISAGRGPLLAIDTATSQIVVALERPGGRPEVAAWPASQRHGEELLTALDGLLRRVGVGLDLLGGIVVGTGPGAFTGLRVGLATAKGLAQALAIPIIGIPTSTALLAPVTTADSGLPPEVTRRRALLLPAGPRDRVLIDEDGPPTACRPGPAGDRPGRRAGGPGSRRTSAGRRAGPRTGSAPIRLGATLLRLAAARLAAGEADDLARLVPEYVSLPRGVGVLSGSIEWSRDPR